MDKNGVINYAEFITAAADISEMITAKHLKEAFDFFDSDGDG
jgi:Ca2+-binding EF-hand superfamily protein